VFETDVTERETRVFVQARMSSRRFPGKVLAPFAGRPLIDHVLEQVAKALPRKRIVVATSTEPSDDPLVAYLRECGVKICRGPLDDVFGRFQECLNTHPSAWFYRVCADSPVLDPRLFGWLQERSGADVDLVTNVCPRSFPKGQSLELVNSDTFRTISGAHLSAEQREHVTQVFYDNPSRFRIVNVVSSDARLSRTSVAVDTLDEFRALEQAHVDRACRTL
jgi:spore coat polysaccharide biosynthesis protein SpsF